MPFAQSSRSFCIVIVLQGQYLQEHINIIYKDEFYVFYNKSLYWVDGKILLLISLLFKPGPL